MLFILSGPTGVGKDTIIQEVRKTVHLVRVPSCVTRKKRQGEVGYRYFTKNEFLQIANNGEFLEYVKVHGEDYYGTLIADVKDAQNSKQKYIKILDVLGYKKIKQQGVKCIGIFIDPPSKDELKQRIINRGESEGSANLRLSRVDMELSMAKEYDHRVVNKKLDTCVKEVIKIINSY